MPAESNATPFPSRSSLTQFFRMDPRQRVPVDVLSQLYGASDDQVRQLLRAEDIPLRSDSIEWGEAATYLFDAWPRARIIDALGSELSRLIPPAFHSRRVPWRIPIFIIRAMQHQAALAWENDPRRNAAAAEVRFTPHAVDDYVADILFNEIQLATVDALGDVPEFLQGYRYPPLD